MMNVYAGQREWQQCASMPQRRISFQFGVMDGKIYVFEGSDHGIRVHESVVHDPKANVWSLTRPMMYGESIHRVVVLGDEKWKVLERFEHHHMGKFFTVKGKLYRIEIHSVLGIFVDNFDGQGNRSTTRLHLFSFLKEGVEVTNSMKCSLFMQVCPLEDGSGEILVLCVQADDAFLFKSEGFGSSNELLPCLWIDVPFPEFPEPEDDLINYVILPFQL